MSTPGLNVTHPYRRVPWRCLVEVAPGVTVETLPPCEAKDAPSIGRAALEAERERWPGIFVARWRRLFGDPVSGPDSRALRAIFRATTPPRYHRLLRRLDGGALEAYAICYMASHERWALLVRAAVEAELDRQAPVGPRAAIAGPGASPDAATPFTPEFLASAFGEPGRKVKARRAPKAGDTLVMPGGASVSIPKGGS